MAAQSRSSIYSLEDSVTPTDQELFSLFLQYPEIDFDEPAAAFAPRESTVEGGLIALGALLISPLGYLAIPVLGTASGAAAHALF